MPKKERLHVKLAGAPIHVIKDSAGLIECNASENHWKGKEGAREACWELQSTSAKAQLDSSHTLPLERHWNIGKFIVAPSVRGSLLDHAGKFHNRDVLATVLDAGRNWLY